MPEVASAVGPGQVLDERALAALPPLALAYVGDAVYELHVRVSLVGQGLTRTNSLHKQTVAFVKAQSQAALLRALVPILTAEELSVARRGRNSKGGGVPRGATVADYRWATGFEALVGFLFLSGQESRLADILQRGQLIALQSRSSDPICVEREADENQS